MDWFLYDNGLHHDRVKVKHVPALFLTARIQKFKLDIAFSLSMSPEKAGNWVLQGVH